MNATAAIRTIEALVAGPVLVATHSYTARKVADHYEIEANHIRGATVVIVETAADLFNALCSLSSRREAFSAVQDVINVYG